MSKPLVVSIPHRLGKDEAVRRLKSGLTSARTEFANVFTIQEDECLAAMAAVTDARVAYLPCGFDPEVHRPLVLTEDRWAGRLSPADFPTPTAARSNLHSARQPSHPTSRAFLHWRLSDDGRGARRIVPVGRHPKPCTVPEVG